MSAGARILDTAKIRTLKLTLGLEKKNMQMAEHNTQRRFESYFTFNTVNSEPNWLHERRERKWPH